MIDVRPPDTDGVTRRRTALVLVALALVLPVVLSAITSLLGGLGGVATGVWSSSLPVAVLGVAAAAVAPVSVGPRLAVIVTGVLGVGVAAVFAASVDTVGVALAGAGLGAVSLAGLPALAWLGRALGRGIDARLDRAWRTGLLVAAGLAGALLLVNLATALTYGLLLRGLVGVPVGLAVQQALGTMFTVAGLHLVACAVRSVRALDGVDPGELRPRLLVAAHGAAALWGIVAGLSSSVVLTG